MSKIIQLSQHPDAVKDLDLVDYVQAQMDSEQAQTFEQELNQSEELKTLLAQEVKLSHVLSSQLEYEVSDSAFSDFENQLDEPQGITPRPTWYSWAGIAVIALVIVGGYSLNLSPRESSLQSAPVYAALSDGSQIISANNSDTLYSLIFSPTMSMDERQHLADNLGFKVVSPQGAGGTYQVKFNSAPSKQALQLWRSRKDILFIEPVILEAAR